MFFLYCSTTLYFVSQQSSWLCTLMDSKRGRSFCRFGDLHPVAPQHYHHHHHHLHDCDHHRHHRRFFYALGRKAPKSQKNFTTLATFLAKHGRQACAVELELVWLSESLTHSPGMVGFIWSPPCAPAWQWYFKEKSFIINFLMITSCVVRWWDELRTFRQMIRWLTLCYLGKIIIIIIIIIIMDVAIIMKLWN